MDIEEIARAMEDMEVECEECGDTIELDGECCGIESRIKQMGMV